MEINSLPDRFRAIIDKVTKIWAPGCVLKVLKQIAGGRSGAPVLLVDIAPTAAVSPQDAVSNGGLSGEFILKLDELRPWQVVREPDIASEPATFDSALEDERHNFARAHSTSFAPYIPALLRSACTDGFAALLYQIAGQTNLDHLQTLDMLDAQTWRLQCQRVSLSLLERFNASYQIDQSSSAKQTLRDWLGYRLQPTHPGAARLHEVSRRLSGGKAWLLASDRAIADPLWLCSNNEVLEQASKPTRFMGALHGDLHSRNILRHRNDYHADRFWLIDFALACSGPLFYDHAYLELSLILDTVHGNRERLRQLISALSYPSASPEAHRVTPADESLLRCLRGIRDAVTGWQMSREPDRASVVETQMQLARVAVGLNWANKPFDTDEERIVAYEYGAWAATHYLSSGHRKAWDSVLANEGMAITSDSTPPSLPATSTATDSSVASPVAAPSRTAAPNTTISLWNELYELVHRFDATRSKYVLVVGDVQTSDDLTPLAMLPWSIIFDFNPDSDTDGLHHVVGPVLQKLRAVRTFGRSILDSDFSRGTAWVMAAGWNSHEEAAPQTSREWWRSYPQIIREVTERLHTSVSPQAIKVIVCPGPHLEGERLLDAVRAIDEKLGDGAEFIFLSTDATITDSVDGRAVPLNLTDFLTGVRQLYGSSIDEFEPTVPGEVGGTFAPVPIPLDRLRHLEEDLTILHSKILAQSNQDHGEFWKGYPPSWSDLHGAVDVIRDCHEPLLEDLRIHLSQHRVSTIELWHEPGAGGTTAALRAAWMLRDDYPVAVIDRYSKSTGERVRALSLLSKRPVLLVADASVLPRSAQDDLYSSLAAGNNRAVILYVVRSTRIDERRQFQIAGSMQASEAARFLRAYSALTDDQDRKTELARITNDQRLARYRSAFFYGLITFERDFHSIDRFVRARIQGIGPRAGRVLEYLALTTMFTQLGISGALLRRMLGLSADSDLRLEEAFDPGPASLILDQGDRVKLLHPLIADEVLQQRIGGPDFGWLDRLKELADLFIDDSIRCMGSDARELHELFFQLFISRGAAPELDDSEVVDRDLDEQTSPRAHFSDLIGSLPRSSERNLILKKLTVVCADNPHYFNHLGRQQIYETGEFAEAERNLLEAVRLSEGRDFLHQHTLGLVRRNWLYRQMDELFKLETKPTPDRVLAEIEELSDRATENFEQCQLLAPTNGYGYVTYVQMVNRIAERLVQAASSSTVDVLIEGSGRVAEWLRRNLTTAQELMDTIEHLLGRRVPSRFIRDCQAAVGRLYGDYDILIKKWETLLLADPSQDQALRRSLANIYRDRRGRDWASMTIDELRRVVVLLDKNLSVNPTNDRDLRVWFQAFRRLPEFSFVDALSRFERWAARADSGEAHYYLYIMHFLRWMDNLSESNEPVLEHLKRSRRLLGNAANSDHSYEWLGVPGGLFPVVSNRELGAWNRDAGVHEHSSTKLRRVTGTIKHFDSPRQAWVQIGEGLDAFFAPRGFFKGQDEGKKITFYLGFTYEGLRAYDPQFGMGEPLPRFRKTPVGALSSTVASTPARITEADRLASERDTLFARTRRIVLDVVAAAEAGGKVFDAGILGSRLKEELLGEAIHLRLGYGTFVELLRAIPEIVIVPEGTRQLVQMRRTSQTTSAESQPAPIPSGPERVRGQVEKFDKGYGFIRADDGRRVFVHHTDIVGIGFRSLDDGEVVEFECDQDAKGWHARRVRRVNTKT
jgi:cold shock CspA family protein